MGTLLDLTQDQLRQATKTQIIWRQTMKIIIGIFLALQLILIPLSIEAQPLSDITLEQLKSATKEQIISRINDKLNSMTKRQIIEWIWTIRAMAIADNVFPDSPIAIDGKNGQISRLEVFRDILGNKIKSTKTEWSYYFSGPVDIIIITEMDQNNKVISVKKLKHYTDGRQPGWIK